MERARRSELRDVRCFLDLLGRMPRRLFSQRPCCFSAPSGVRKCGACCRAFPGWNLTAPCLPGLPVIPEFNGGGAPTSPIGAGLRAPNIGDPCEVVAKSIVGDSFPEADWHQAPTDLAFGMGQWAKYLYALPSENITVVSMG